MTRLTDAASTAAELAKDGWEPPHRWWAGAAKGKLRQGDLLVGYHHQLRARTGELEGPGSEQAASAKLPFLAEYEDVDVAMSGAELTLRVWRGWVMIVEQSCEIAQKDPGDSRMLVAPVVFRAHWDGPHWAHIRRGQSPGLVYLPPIDAATAARFSVKGWLDDSDAAVMLESTCCVSRQMVPGAHFGLSGDMRAILQTRQADFWTVRGWMRDKWAQTVTGKRIASVDQTYEQFQGPGRLHKVHLDDGAGGGGDEVTVGWIFSP